MKRRLLNRLNKIRFGIRWLTMSPRDRYTYLWNRTRNSPEYQASPETARYANRAPSLIAFNGLLRELRQPESMLVVLLIAIAHELNKELAPKVGTAT